jgi:stress response protein YsnF
MATADKQAGATGDTLVGVYDDYTQAENARSDLLRSGFSEFEVMLAYGAGGPPGQAIDGDQLSYRGIRSMFTLDSEHHDLYAEAVRRGSHVLTVNVDGEAQMEQALAIMSRDGAVDIEERSTHWKNEGWTGYDTGAQPYSSEQIAQERSRHAQQAEGARIPVIEETLAVGKREVQRGGVRVVKRMRETPVQESLDLRSEHVRVERQAVDRPATEEAFREQTVELREAAEEPVVAKTARVVEEVVVDKEVTQRRADIQDSVRRTEVEVENLDASAGSIDDSDFRSHWQNAYGNAGGRYEDYDAAYRYGSTMAGSERFRNYQGADWNRVEPDLRSDWEKDHPGSAWEKIKDAVRYGAERVTGQRRR